MTWVAEGYWSLGLLGEGPCPGAPCAPVHRFHHALASIQSYHLTFLFFANLVGVKWNFNVALILIARGEDVYGFVWCGFFLLWWDCVYSLATAHGAAFRLCRRIGAQGLAYTWSSHFSRIYRARLQLCSKGQCVLLPPWGQLCFCGLPERGQGGDKWKSITTSGTNSKDTLTAGTPAGLSQAQRCCQENDSISTDAVLVWGGLWRIAYKKPKNCLNGICVGGEKEKGIWSLLESSVLCVLLLWAVCAAASPSIV